MAAPPGADRPAPPDAPVLAEPGQRLLARIVDTLLVGLPVVMVVREVAPRGDFDVVAPPAVAALLFVYEAVQLAVWGRTLGKRFAGIEVVRADALPAEALPAPDPEAGPAPGPAAGPEAGVPAPGPEAVPAPGPEAVPEAGVPVPGPEAGVPGGGSGAVPAVGAEAVPAGGQGAFPGPSEGSGTPGDPALDEASNFGTPEPVRPVQPLNGDDQLLGEPPPAFPRTARPGTTSRMPMRPGRPRAPAFGARCSGRPFTRGRSRCGRYRYSG
ncbi:hypothetical protein GEV43_18010 [Actinomadura sp. J1-007]|uniref:RDD family protein n=1 Tax=Actinomadura sp. J1-007 TaxID=2661913 RepID=UPI00132276C2|nr:RDD family protein [Actinomadura sp. J1-007]MWK35749.1 hypothetical protein [Actinomadura sp. J1-007]